MSSSFRHGFLGFRWVQVLFIAAVLTGCPSSQKRNVEIPTPMGGDARARERFAHTKAKFERDEAKAEDFIIIAKEFPEDPVAAHAQLFAGMAYLKDGNFEAASAPLSTAQKEEGAAPETVALAEMLLGITWANLEDYGRAYPLLKKHEARLPQFAGSKDAGAALDQVMVWAALAESSFARGPKAECLRYYAEWEPLATAAEKSHIKANVASRVSQVSLTELEAVWPKFSSTSLAKMVAEKMATAYLAQNRPDRAKAILAQVSSAEQPSAEQTNPGQIAAILPMTGKRNRVGDALVRGLALASKDQKLGLSVYDEGQDAARAVSSLDKANQQGAIGVIGPFDARSAEQAGKRASELGIPMITLSPAADSSLAAGLPGIFHLVPSPVKRASALAKIALSQKKKTAAIMAPNNRFGSEVSAAFVQTFTAGGGKVVSQVQYDEKETSFQAHVRKLQGDFATLFIADVAPSVELIAPALAAENLLVKPIAEQGKAKTILLVALADSIGPEFLRRAGRYVRGLIVAPGFYPDRTRADVADFVSEYETSLGGSPTAMEAYAYDAWFLLKRFLSEGAQTREDLRLALSGANVNGLTGPISFDGRGLRQGPGQLYEVRKLHDNQVEIVVWESSQP